MSDVTSPVCYRRHLEVADGARDLCGLVFLDVVPAGLEAEDARSRDCGRKFQGNLGLDQMLVISEFPGAISWASAIWCKMLR